jgi:hypothetical protein
MFEKPQKAQVVRIKIEAVSLESSMAPSLDGPLLADWRITPTYTSRSADCILAAVIQTSVCSAAVYGHNRIPFDSPFGGRE